MEIWVDTAADRAKITYNIRDLADMKATDDSWKHKEAGPTRMKRDEKDVKVS